MASSNIPSDPIMSTTSAIFGKLALHTAHNAGNGTIIPAFLYGTAWKKEKSSDLVYQALCSGFRAVDTAAQPKHYNEASVGEGIRRAIAEGKVKRSEMFLQTKYTPINGQDPENMPYDSSKSITEQVRASVISSLHNLRHAEDPQSSYIDSLVLHSPLSTMDDTMEAWNAMQAFVPHQVHNLGISNTNLFTLMEVFERSTIRPAVVQNRFYPKTKFDIGIRKFCHENHIIYQSFWTLTANPTLLWGAEVGSLANQVGITPQAALYCLVLGLGNTVMLNGTQKKDHMAHDLAAVQEVYAWASKYPASWDTAIERFKKRIGQPGDI